MAQLVVMYKTPADPAAFDAHYFGVHVPIAKGIPGLKRYEVTTGPVLGPGGPTGIHLIATLHFDTMADIQAAFGSAEGQAASADMANFAAAGAEMFMVETRDV